MDKNFARRRKRFIARQIRKRSAEDHEVRNCSPPQKKLQCTVRQFLHHDVEQLTSKYVALTKEVYPGGFDNRYTNLCNTQCVFSITSHSNIIYLSAIQITCITKAIQQRLGAI